MDKGTTVEQIREARHKLAEHGIRAAFFLQFGYLGETQEDIDATLEMLFELMPDDIGISVSYPLPGTPFYERVQEDLVGKANWTDSDELAMMFRNTHSPDFYRRLHRYVHRAYRSAQARAKLAGGLRGRETLRSSARAAVAWPVHGAAAVWQGARLRGLTP